MTTTKDQTVAAGHSVAPARWQAGLKELLGRVAGRFGRVEPRRHARAFVLGLLADLPRRNCWTIAEHAGDSSPDGMQHLLARAVWDHNAIRDDVRGAYVVEHLGDSEAVLAAAKRAGPKRADDWEQGVVKMPPAAGEMSPLGQSDVERQAQPGS